MNRRSFFSLIAKAAVAVAVAPAKFFMPDGPQPVDLKTKFYWARVDITEHLYAARLAAYTAPPHYLRGAFAEAFNKELEHWQSDLEQR